MKRWLIGLMAIGMAVSAMAADYEVYDVKVKGRSIEEDFDGASIGAGSATGWLVYDWDTGTSTFIMLEKGYSEQGWSEVDIYEYISSVKDTDTKYIEKGVTECWYDIYFSDVNIWGCALGKYTWIVDYRTFNATSKVSLKGAGSLLIDEYYGGYISSIQVKSNSKLTAGINEAFSAEWFMEQQCLSKTGWPVDLSWSWMTP